jgi:hypothetical protein
MTTKEVHRSSPQKSRIWYAPTKESVHGTGVFSSFVGTVLDVCRTQLQTFGLSVSNFSIAELHISFIGVSHYSDGRGMLIADWWVHLTFRAVSTSGTYVPRLFCRDRLQCVLLFWMLYLVQEQPLPACFFSYKTYRSLLSNHGNTDLETLTVRDSWSPYSH